MQEVLAMGGRPKAYGAAAFVPLVATALLAGGLIRPACGQADRVVSTIVSGTVLDLDGRPVAGVLIGYAAAEEIRSETAPRRLLLPNGRRQGGEGQPQDIIGSSTQIRREGHASMTATPPPTTTGSQEETVTSDTMRRLGRATAPEMIAQLPSNVGNLLVDGNHDGEREWLVHPSGIAFVGGKLAGETDAAGNFSVELPRGGTYVITARIETPDIRGYGSKQPVVVETGRTLRLPAIILSLITSE